MAYLFASPSKFAVSDSLESFSLQCSRAGILVLDCLFLHLIFVTTNLFQPSVYFNTESKIKNFQLTWISPKPMKVVLHPVHFLFEK